MINNPALDSAVDRLKEYLESYLLSQKIHIDPATKKFKCINPEHSDKTPSCFIVPDSNGQIFHCFGCGSSGNIFHAANWLEGLPRTGIAWVNSTIDVLCKRYEIPCPTIELSPEQQELLEASRAYEEAGRIIKYSTLDTHVPAFEERGWADELGVKYGVGFVSSYQSFLNQLKAQNYDESYLQRIGLCRKDMFDHDRMIFNIQDHHGQVVGFAARNLNYEKEKEAGQDISKYINTSSDAPLYRKREILYGLHIAKNSAIKQGLIIVEGYADWIALQEAGIKNVVAVCGTALTKEHVHLLNALGVSRITLCLDNDEGGNLGTIRILDDVIGEVPSIQVDILILPNGQDPDDFMQARLSTERNIAWKELKPISCFEYRLSRFPANADGTDIANAMIPLVLTEPNSLNREKMMKELSRKTDVRLSAIQKQVDKMSTMEEYKRSEQLVSIVSACVKDLKKDPGSARELLTEYLSRVEQTQHASSLDLVGSEEVLTAFDSSTVEWSKEKKNNILGIATHFEEFDNASNGCQEGRVIGIGGKPNHGKSAFVLTVAHQIATRNPDCMVIIHSTDDNREVVFSRLMAIDQELPINAVTNLKWYGRLREPITLGDGTKTIWNQEMFNQWKRAKENISGLISDGKLVIKDSTHGSTLAFTETMIKYYKEKYPEKRILVIFDNFHKAQDYMEKEERIRFKMMSHRCKYLAEKYHVAFMATMEYTKLGPGIRPENSDLAETVQMEYDLSMILHVYNELKDIGIDKAKLVTILEDGAETLAFPIVDIRVGKNKQTAFQDRLYYNFYPEKGKFVETTVDTARNAMQRGSDKKMQGLGGK